MEKQFSEEQSARAFGLLDSLAWGDVTADLCAFENALSAALDATRGYLDAWEAMEIGGFDEFDLTPEQIGALTDRQRLAWVGRLLENIRLCYGVDEYVGYEGRSGLAGLLLGFAEIARVTSQHECFRSVRVRV
jgi:hypothetical protein